MAKYNPFNWYWKADDNRIFSSSRAAIVAANDATYQAWLAGGNVPTRWPVDSAGAQTTASLQDVLTPYRLFASLQAYASAKQQAIAAGGISVNVGTSNVPQLVEASTDPASLVLLQGAYAMAQANASATFQWVQNSGVAVQLTAAQVIAIFNAVTAFLQATFTTLSAVIAGITANPPTITTTAQVDAFASPAWPANS